MFIGPSITTFQRGSDERTIKLAIFILKFMSARPNRET